MIREIGDTVGEAVAGTVGRAMSRTQEKRPLPVDLLESEDAYLAIFDAPGALSSDMQVTYENGTILVRLDRFREFKDGFKMVFPGRGLALDGRVDLPDDVSVDPEAATATLKDDGTLHVTVPKADTEADHEQQVDVETEADDGDEDAE
ncbi:Hsp20/alpha crystallin family protein [Halobacteriaceae archaeon SHR40]|uniref:Hsp20/alpha crystallin family protein n=1 Tax=Halovenus amylolytica TaxID=2500550 RepID=UPI000FE32450